MTSKEKKNKLISIRDRISNKINAEMNIYGSHKAEYNTKGKTKL